MISLPVCHQTFAVGIQAVAVCHASLRQFTLTATSAHCTFEATYENRRSASFVSVMHGEIMLESVLNRIGDFTQAGG